MTPTDRPNVLLVCVDHWPGSLLGIAGHSAILTPTLDQVAAGGVLFSRAYSATPVCIPARRALMTGLSTRSHGDRCFDETRRMPPVTTLAEAFHNSGYQTYAVGKLHVYPQRDRIGFDDVLLNEEGRHHLGLRADDYEQYVADQGYPGQELTHGMPTGDYITRPWHLPEHLHPTNWSAREMCRTIRRRDPTRPAFWYLSFNAPHPPIVPPECYLDMYREIEIPPPAIGDWAANWERLPFMLQNRTNIWYANLRYPDGRRGLRDVELRLARRAFYALCTHVDHQLRLVLGMLREEGILNNTVIAFTSDHGDMLGDHNLYCKGLLYDESARVPLFIVPASSDNRLTRGVVDDRLVELRDVMPTLLDLAGLPIPDTVEGHSLLTDTRRPYLYGEYEESDLCTRMLRDERYKLIYYPTGNVVQLFDLDADPTESHDLAADPAHRAARERLTATLIDNLYGDDLDWVRDGALIGRPDRPFAHRPDRNLTQQRGWRFL